MNRDKVVHTIATQDRQLPAVVAEEQLLAQEKAFFTCSLYRKIAFHFACGPVEQSDLCLALHREPLSVQTESELRDLILACGDRAADAPGRQFPHLDGPIGSSRGQTASIGLPDKFEHRQFVSGFQTQQLLAAQ